MGKDYASKVVAWDEKQRERMNIVKAYEALQGEGRGARWLTRMRSAVLGAVPAQKLLFN